ncbi:sulfatase, partial [Algoriphagus sp.]
MNLIGFALLLFLFPFQKPIESKPPNILFLIADDWSYPHAGIYGDLIVRTPTFDWLAKEGALFTHAFTASPSCSPSRASILLGRYPHQNGDGGNLWSEFPNVHPTYVQILEANGYFSGSKRKGWGPGEHKVTGFANNPAGKSFDDFATFLNEKPKDQPFTFWFGSSDPHREYMPNTGIQSGMKLWDVIVPGFFPDNDCVRNDILDYYFEIERFDRESGQLIALLKEMGELDNTIIVMTSDNGMPFPRAKANLYDYGTRMPLAIRWPEKVNPGTVIDAFVNFVDFAPSFVEAAGLSQNSMSGQSLWGLLSGEKQDRKQVYLERERHANVRKGNLSYPMRGVRNQDYLYIWNPMPERN